MSASYSQWVKDLRRNIGSAEFPDLAVRWKPDAVNVPEALGYSVTTDIVGADELSFLQRSIQNGLVIQNQETLKELNFPYLSDVVSNMIVTGNASLASIVAPNITLPLYGEDPTSGSGASIDFSGNALSAECIDNLLNRLALSLSSGHAYYLSIDLSGGTNAVPTTASELARSSLYLAATGYHIDVTVET